MIDTAACQTDSALHRYLHGEASDLELEVIGAHLSRCPTCLGRVAELEGTEFSAIRPRSEPTIPEPALERAVSRLLDTTPSPSAVAPAALAAGDRVGEYRLIEAIGEGGMGTTFRAVHQKLDRVVALKVLRPALLHDVQAVARFHREMLAIGRLSHPNIVAAADAGEAGGHLFLAMELVPGETLSQRVRRQGALPISEAVRVGLDVARALEHAHAAGLVHRDVKPSNVMLTPDGAVKLLDLGLVRLINHDPPTTGDAPEPTRLSDAAGAIGTSDYMAPEQWRCARVDARADQYGLGCLLFYLLVGRPPFVGENSRTSYDKMQLHLNEPPPSARRLRKEVPPLLDRVIERLLAKKPGDRFADMAAVIGHLQAVADGRRAAMPAAPPRPGRRWRVLLPVSLVLVLAAVGTLFAIRPWAKVPDPVTHPAPTPVPAPPPPPPGRLPMTEAEAVALQKGWAASRREPVAESHPTGMVFLLIPPGEFAVSKQTKVRFEKAYRLAKTEVTTGQFRAFIADTGHRTMAEETGGGYLPPLELDTKNPRRKVEDATWKTPGYDGATDDHPVTQVSWSDAAAFCDWLSVQDGRTYRLPTEWEWQWACRAGLSGNLPDPDLPAHAWYRENSELHPRPVGGRKANPWGLLDMYGNVHEWAGSWFQVKPLPGGTIIDPVGDTSGPHRTICGGGFESKMPTPQHREAFPPNYPYVKIGFRVLVELDEKE